MALNDKQRFFVVEYLKSRNATKAATAAGYSAKTAQQQGSRLLSHVEIKAEIEQGTTEHLAMVEAEAVRAVLSRHQVLLEDSAIATSNLWDLIERVTSRGIIWKDMNDMPPQVQRLVQRVKVDPEKGNVEIAMHSKHPSLERLAKYHHLFDPPEKGTDTDPETVPELALRAAAWLEGLAVKLHRPPEDITLAETVAMLREGAKRQRAVEEHAPAGE